MQVELKSLQPNPYRDFTIDPYDDDNIEALAKSIKEDGFWGGVVCRRADDGEIQIGAGHHRVKAAIKAGIRTADLFVGDFDDAAMIRVYARENATQRGNSSTAVAGTVASATRFLAKGIMTGSLSGKIARNTDLAKVRGNLESEKGLGRDLIVDLLEDVPGVNESTVREQLSNLKASGDYARIIGEVKAEIEQEHKEALKALERAERERAKAEEASRKAEEERKAAAARAKAAREEAEKKRAAEAQKRAEIEADLAEKRRAGAEAAMKDFDKLRTIRDTANAAAASSAEREITFDFEGVARHLKNDNQVRVFREVVTGDGIRPYLPVGKQAALAKKVVSMAADGELSGRFIRENVTNMVLFAKGDERRLFSREELLHAQKASRISQFKSLQHEFARAVRNMNGTGVAMKEMIDNNKGVTFPILPEFRDAVRTAERVIATLSRKL